MRAAHPLEQTVGMAYYVSDVPGIGGSIRHRPEDFQVREIESIDPEPIAADPAAYPHLIVRVTLHEWDTNEFVSRLATELGISRERISWAGTKDKRAVTTQLFSIADGDPNSLPSISNASLDPIGRYGRPLLYGDLIGNEFDIRIHDPTSIDHLDAIDEALTEFGDGARAVPNYFGQQRFGSRRPVTHKVGLHMLDRNWKKAVMAYIGNPTSRESADARHARTYIEETEDWAGGLERMPTHLRHERALLHALVDSEETDNRFRQAFSALQTNLQHLFVHAAQSYLFNRIVSRRLEEGLPFTEAVEGDVICFGTEQNDLFVLDPDTAQPVTGDRLQTVNRHLDRGRARITAPLIGTETRLGSGQPGTIERAILDDLGVSKNAFDLPDPFASTGTRRSILLQPEVTIHVSPLRFDFRLPKGSYATVLLREYLKTSPEQLA